MNFRMRGRAVRLAALATALSLGTAAAAPPPGEPVTGDRATDMAVDLIVVRPLGVVATVIGSVGFVLALPFTLPTGSTGETACEWIGAPLEYTFNRRLGEFDACGADRHPCGGRR